MKKFFTIAVAALFAVCMSAQMRVWVNGSINYERDLSLIDSITFVKVTTPAEQQPEEPANPNFHATAFTVNREGKQVYFSQGNLQYQASTNTWRFAENQYDAIGEGISNISSTNEGWIDLFGWGTSGYDNTANDPFAINYQPWSTSYDRLMQTVTIKGTEIESINCDMKPITGKCDTTWVGGGTYESRDNNCYGYGPSTFMADKNLTGTNANYDWGVFNAIVNGGNQKDKWRTLSYEEWYYIFYTRNLAQYLRSQATVCGVHGYVLLPDDFTLPDGLSWSYQTNDWDTNTYNAQAWSAMEATGAVFLPAAGYRKGTGCGGVGSRGCYWSSSYYDKEKARYVNITDSGVNFYSNERFYGQSVRLVQDL